MNWDGYLQSIAFVRGKLNSKELKPPSASAQMSKNCGMSKKTASKGMSESSEEETE